LYHSSTRKTHLATKRFTPHVQPNFVLAALTLALACLLAPSANSKSVIDKGSTRVGGDVFLSYFTGRVSIDGPGTDKGFQISLGCDKFITRGVSLGIEAIAARNVHSGYQYKQKLGRYGLDFRFGFFWQIQSSLNGDGTMFLFTRIQSGVNWAIQSTFEYRYSTSWGWYWDNGFHSQRLIPVSITLGLMPLLSKNVALEIGGMLRKDFPNAMTSFTTLQFGAGFAVFAL
jgi:hypothetical protein